MANTPRQLCVICGPTFLEGRNPLGKTLSYVTNTGAKPSERHEENCKACNGNGYAIFRSDKEV